MKQLIPKEKIRSFFDILHTLDRCNSHLYDGMCQQEIFVKKTIHKWFKGKNVVILATDPKTNVIYKRYLCCTGIRLHLGWSKSELVLHLFDYSSPQKMVQEEKWHFNDFINLEGEWIDDKSPHSDSLTSLVNLLFVVEKKDYTFNLIYRNLKTKGPSFVTVKGRNFDEAQKAVQIYNTPRSIVGDLIE